MIYFFLIVNFVYATFMHKLIYQMRNVVDLDYKHYKAERLRNRVSYVEFVHFMNFNQDNTLSNNKVIKAQKFVECMYKQQIDYVSFEFLVFALSGLPEFNERKVA
jgi:hypothetical protein